VSAKPVSTIDSIAGDEGPGAQARRNGAQRILEKRAMTISARYEKGVFRPLQDVPIKEGTLVEVHVPPDAPANRPRSIGDSPFAGMWKDREDMTDSVE
jgi:hypothetical protein